MIVLCVDDEKLLLEALKRAVESAPEVTEAEAFTDEVEALEWAKKNPFDAAFLDIELPEINGLELAKKLAEIDPDISVVFCTSYEQYAVRAIGLHMDIGYLIKPIRAKQVREEIARIAADRAAARKEAAGSAPALKAVCFGHFDVYAGERPLDFKRTKTKELFAYLIDRRGAAIGARELCAVLWENEENDAKTRDYLYHLISDIKTTLQNAGAEDALLIRREGYAVDTSRIDCDYYRVLAGDRTAIRQYNGEYMYQYSWAEETNAWLEREYGDGQDA